VFFIADGHGGFAAHTMSNRFGFNRFGFNRFSGSNQFNGGWDWGGGYGWGYGGDDYSYNAVPPNVVVLVPQPTPGAAALPRGDLPPCHETSFRVVVDRGMGCSVPQPTSGTAPSRADNLTPSQADVLTPSQADDPPPSRAEYLPPCHEVTAVGPVVERGTACSRGSG
jgi:hypothetical protein